MDCIEHQYYATIYHVPFVECQFIQEVWDEGIFRDADCIQQRPLPEAPTTNVRSEGIYKAKGQDAFDGSGDNAESKRMGMVFIPSLDIEGE